MSDLAPAIIAGEWTDERTEFIRKAFCGGAPDAIAMTFIEIAKRRNLSPEERHIYLVNRGGKDRPNWVIQTGIDGYRSMAARTGDYAGSDAPVFMYTSTESLRSASVTVWRFVRGQRCAFTASALWDEYSVPHGLWQKMPHTMLAKCAEALALRKGFPAELAGIYTSDEMDQAGQPAAPLQEQPPPTHTRAVAEVIIDNETGEILPAVTEQPARVTDQELFAHIKRLGAELDACQSAGARTIIKDEIDRLGLRSDDELRAKYEACSERLRAAKSPQAAQPQQAFVKA